MSGVATHQPAPRRPEDHLTEAPEHSHRQSDRASAREARAARVPIAFACVLAMLCVAVVGLGPSPALAAPTLGWSLSATDGGGQPSAVSCASESMCVVVDRTGNALSSGDPISPEAHWTSTSVDKGQPLTAVACPASGLCVAVDAGGRALASTNPLAAAWSAPASINSGSALTGVACMSASACVAVDSAGEVLASAVPSSGSGWTLEYKDSSALRGVSCDASECVAVDSAGTALASTNPLGGPGSWRARAIDPAGAANAISCTAGRGCVAVDAAGNALASANPAALAPTWSSTAIDFAGLAAVSCSSAGLCVAVGGHGEALASDNPAAPLPVWSETSPGGVLAGVACMPAGFCIAADSTGRVLSGHVPAPGVATATPAEVTATTAQLTGTVEPNDANLLSCAFEYGTTTAYGQSVPCQSLPTAGGGAQSVSAQLSGLQPNRTYHYRLLASSAAGGAASADATLTTATSTQVPLVFPHPTISGTPAVGQRLSCHTGLPAGASVQIAYAWLRDLRPIPSATGSSYVVKGADSGHHLQCQVSATNGGGSATARSAFVTIPFQGVPASTGETVIGRAHARGARVSVPVICSPLAPNGCRLVLRVTAVETLRGGRLVAITARSPARPAAGGGLRRRTVTFAATTVRLGRGQRATVTLNLNAAARGLLTRRHRLPLRIAASGTVVGVLEASLGEQTLELGAARRASRVRGASRRG
jgi:hypothetical protein